MMMKRRWHTVLVSMLLVFGLALPASAATEINVVTAGSPSPWHVLTAKNCGPTKRVRVDVLTLGYGPFDSTGITEVRYRPAANSAWTHKGRIGEHDVVSWYVNSGFTSLQRVEVRFSGLSSVGSARIRLVCY